MSDPATGASHAPLPRGSVTAAVAVAVVGAALLTVIIGVFATTGGTLAVSGACGVAIGLFVASAALPGPLSRGVRAKPALTRATTGRLAMGIALGMVLLAGMSVWVLAISEGGVLDPVSYLWTTFGFGFPAQGLLAVVGAAWGAASGPVRWRR